MCRVSLVVKCNTSNVDSWVRFPYTTQRKCRNGGIGRRKGLWGKNLHIYMKKQKKVMSAQEETLEVEAG